MNKINQTTKDWEVKKLGEVCDIFNGSTPLRTRSDFWENGEINWFTIKDIRREGRFIRETEQLITKKAFEETSITLLPKDTVLLCCTASVGEYAMAEVELTTNQQFNGLVIKDKKSILPLFLYYFSSTLKEQLLDKSGKTTIDFVSMKKLKDFEISFPKSLTEQKRIVGILDEAFENIDQAKTIAEKNLKNIDELFNSELQNIFSNNGDEWETKKIEELVDHKSKIVSGPFGSNLMVKDYKDEGCTCLKTSEYR
jgi:restriction endonuclease S subunit